MPTKSGRRRAEIRRRHDELIAHPGLAVPRAVVELQRHPAMLPGLCRVRMPGIPQGVSYFVLREEVFVLTLPPVLVIWRS